MSNLSCVYVCVSVCGPLEPTDIFTQKRQPANLFSQVKTSGNRVAGDQGPVAKQPPHSVAWRSERSRALHSMCEPWFTGEKNPPAYYRELESSPRRMATALSALRVCERTRAELKSTPWIC